MKTFTTTVKVGNGQNSIVIDRTKYTLSAEQISLIVVESRKMFDSPTDHTLFCAHLSLDILGSYNGHPPGYDDEDVVRNPYAIVAAVIAQNHQTCWEVRMTKPCTAILFDGIGPLIVTPVTENLNIRCECTYT